MLVRPIGMNPAARSRATEGASRAAGAASRSTTEPAVVIARNVEQVLDRDRDAGEPRRRGAASAHAVVILRRDEGPLAWTARTCAGPRRAVVDRARQASTRPRLFAPATSSIAVFAMLRMLTRFEVDKSNTHTEIAKQRAALIWSAAPSESHISVSLVGACVSHVLSLTLHGGSDTRPIEIAIDQAVIAGWTGRDPEAVEKHIKELEALGVKRPATTPIFYRVSAARLTTGDNRGGGRKLRRRGRIRAAAARRPALGRHRLRPYRSRGGKIRGHASPSRCATNRSPRALGVRRCRPHWDRLMLRAHVVEGGKRVLYQEGAVTAMIDPRA